MRRQLDGMGGVGGASSTPTVAELTYRGAHIARSSYHCIVARVIYPPSHAAQKPLKEEQNQKIAATNKGDQLAKPWQRQLFVNVKSEGNEEQKPDLLAEKTLKYFILCFYITEMLPVKADLCGWSLPWKG